ncbi:MAG: hypothetical protein KAI66_23230 [Lentisphaeria bacterium]|nr:hypothetical protein [Lentisphaeria bacterium]
MTPSIAERLANGETILGLANSLGDPTIIESMCKGWDFVWIDGQHGTYAGRLDLQLSAVRAAECTGVEAMVRVAGHDYSVLGPVADLGPTMIMVPMVNTTDDAEKIVHGLKFAPLGSRSFGGRRVYDRFGSDYCDHHQPMIVAQIETPEAVENAEDIAAIEGIDALLFGPDDMKKQLGLSMSTGVLESDTLTSLMEQTANAALEAGKVAAAIAPSVELFQLVHGLGYRMIVGGADARYIRFGAAESLEQLAALIP